MISVLYIDCHQGWTDDCFNASSRGMRGPPAAQAVDHHGTCFIVAREYSRVTNHSHELSFNVSGQPSLPVHPVGRACA